MKKRYRLMFSARRAYREAVLDGDTLQMRAGTSVDAEVRFRESDFFAPFSFLILQEQGVWKVECGETIYASGSDGRRLMVCSLQPGEIQKLKYRESDTDILSLYLMEDFDYDGRKYDRAISLQGTGTLKIGAYPDCGIQLLDSRTKEDCLILHKAPEGYMLKAVSTGCGTCLNGSLLRGSALLEEMDFFSVGPYGFCFADGCLYTDSEGNLKCLGVSFTDRRESLSCYDYPKFNRSTRVKELPETEQIKILNPPNAPHKPRINLVTQLLPPVGMLAVVLMVRGMGNAGGASFALMSICSMGIGAATSVLSIRDQKKRYREDVQKRRESYQNYIEEKRKTLEECRKEEAAILEKTYYPASREVQIAEGFLPELFDREAADEDFLEVRLGCGKRKSVRQAEFKLPEQIEPADDLQKLPETVAEEFRYLKHVPITVKLQEQSLVGITGNREALYHMLKLLTLDLAVRHHDSQVKLFYCIGEEDRARFSWLRLLPHLQNEALNRRNLICDEESRTALLEYLYGELSGRRTEEKSPAIVVFVYRDCGIRTHPVAELMRQGREKGITFLFFCESAQLLPGGCGRIIEMSDQLHGRVVDTSGKEQPQEFEAEVLEDSVMAMTVQKLAPVYCEKISLESTLTKKITFFEMLRIFGPEDIDLGKNWKSAQVYRSMAAPLGVNAREEIVCLDVHEKAHGPHGLVAGTTGSGKSEILQSYILSMALLYHPYEVGFVIIDFKGGGMGNQFRRLPHLIGTITNIDGREINRSLLSIRAELKKRQEMFARHNVNHIDAYIRLYKEGMADVPLPHLILIVDEFAELKMEQPEFMKELISTARIGRSLGVHLILATQKPSGVVDPQIWSNSRFKLCLKVQSKEDSNEVLKNPLAAEITEPGRAYLQVGNNEQFELFQSAYSGAPAAAEGTSAGHKFKIARVSLAGKRTVVYEQKPSTDGEMQESQLESVVSYVSGYCKKQKIARLPFICLPPLPEILEAPSYGPREDTAGGLFAQIGLYDDPSSQYQGTFRIRVTTENTIIVGSAQNGKTNLLQAILRSLTTQYTPSEVNLYILDFGSMIFRNFEELPHVGGVVCSNEEEKCKNLFKLLNREVKQRKDKLAAARVSSFASYLEAGFLDLPQIVVMIDNLTAMRELYLTENDFLLPLCRDGIAVGISFVIANSQTGGIGFRYLTNFGQRIALYCNDSTEYNALFEHCRMKPAHTPGRCLVEKDKTIYEAQTYLAFNGEREIDRVAQILDFVRERGAQCKEARAKRIPVVPGVLTAEILKTHFGSYSDSTRFAAGLDYETVAPVELLWKSQGILAVSGKDTLGRSGFVDVLLHTVLQTGVWLYVLDDAAGTLQWCQGGSRTRVYARTAEETEDVLEEWKLDLEERYQQMTEGVQVSDDEPLLLLVIQNRDVIAKISAQKPLLEIYRDTLKKYQGLKACILYTNLENSQISFNAPEVMKMMKDNRQFLLFENLENVRLAELLPAQIRKFKNPLREGEAYLVRGSLLQKIRTVDDAVSESKTP